jgi:hypothetical protein
VELSAVPATIEAGVAQVMVGVVRETDDPLPPPHPAIEIDARRGKTTVNCLQSEFMLRLNCFS